MRLERDPVAFRGRPIDDSPAASNAVADLRLAVDEDARRQEHAARPQLVAERRRERHEQARDEVGEHDVEPAARRSGTLPLARPDAPRRGGSGARWLPWPRWRSGRCRRRGAEAAPSRTAAMARIPRPAPDVEDARAGQPVAIGQRPRAPPGRAGSSDGGRSRTPCPGRARGPRHRGPARWRRHVGRMTMRRPTRRTGKYAFQASAQSASWTMRVRSSPIGRRPNAWRWPSASRGLGDPPLRGGRIARRQIGPDRRRPGRVDTRPEPLVDELEGRLDGRRHPARPARGSR